MSTINTIKPVTITICHSPIHINRLSLHWETLKSNA